MALRATSALQKSGKASGAWLSRQARDPYVKSRAEHPANFRSRSAFKLLEIHEKHGVLGDAWVKNIVDLGAAPGGWSQAAANYFGHLEPTSPGPDPALLDTEAQEHETQTRTPVSDTTIVALDLLPIAPIPGVHTIQADFLSPSATSQIAAVLPKTGQGHLALVDVLLSDMSANHTGNRAADVENALDLAKAVFQFAGSHLAFNTGAKRHPGGTLVWVISKVVPLSML
jgi:23S rRNA (uridine2552-2'-O)-methyltransferase